MRTVGEDKENHVRRRTAIQWRVKVGLIYPDSNCCGRICYESSRRKDYDRAKKTAERDCQGADAGIQPDRQPYRRWKRGWRDGGVDDGDGEEAGEEKKEEQKRPPMIVIIFWAGSVKPNSTSCTSARSVAKLQPPEAADQ
ncbi:hypothetical protein VTN00DRAFT_8870 [Thermoascus crustaceus]|uniref:uncharacterized protein n=1 Tax=Thermoascus crustaceus TaxID=5088 RepID=UPI0037424884